MIKYIQPTLCLILFDDVRSAMPTRENGMIFRAEQGNNISKLTNN